MPDGSNFTYRVEGDLPIHLWKARVLDPAAPLEEVHDRQQEDRTQQGYEHGRDSNGVVDRPNVEDRAEEVTSQEGANHGHDDIDQQVRAVVHQFRGDVTNYSGNDQINEQVHIILLFGNEGIYRAVVLRHNSALKIGTLDLPDVLRVWDHYSPQLAGYPFLNNSPYALLLPERLCPCDFPCQTPRATLKGSKNAGPTFVLAGEGEVITHPPLNAGGGGPADLANVMTPYIAPLCTQNRCGVRSERL